MRLFEADEFEERIQSVENRAGRIAWQVYGIAQVLAFIVYIKITGNDLPFELYYAPLLISYAAVMIVRKRSGLSKEELREERLRIGRTKAGDRIAWKSFVYLVVLMGLLLLIAPDDVSIPSLLLMFAFFIIVWYVSWRWNYGSWPFRTAEDEAGEDAS